MGKVLSCPAAAGQSIHAEKPQVCGRKADAAYGRDRKYVSRVEVRRMAQAAGQQGRNPVRDRALVLVAFNCGLRAGEVGLLRWTDIDLTRGRIHVLRQKAGTPATIPMLVASGLNVREALKSLRRQTARDGERTVGTIDENGAVFASERGSPISVDTVERVVKLAGEEAGIGFPVNAHALRHATGFDLASRGVSILRIAELLGHRSVRSTEVYVRAAGCNLTSVWRG
jgi:integrase